MNVEGTIKKIEEFLMELSGVLPKSVKLAEYKVGEKTVMVDDETMVATIDGEPAPDGEYTTEDGKILVVVDGKVTEIKEPKEEETEVEAAEEGEATESTSDDVLQKKLSEIIDITKDASYSIYVTVNDGKLVWGDIQSYQDITANLSAVDSKVEELKKAYDVKLADQKKEFELKLAELGKQSGGNKVIQAPVNDTPVKLSRKEALKKRILN